jgi:hypothetical protein
LVAGTLLVKDGADVFSTGLQMTRMVQGWRCGLICRDRGPFLARAAGWFVAMAGLSLLALRAVVAADL